METILAVDLKKGKVVRAFAGFRSNYKPLKNTGLWESCAIKCQEATQNGVPCYGFNFYNTK